MYYGLLLIKNLRSVGFSENLQKLEHILNKYLNQPFTPSRLYDCQDELIEAGFEEYAQL